MFAALRDISDRKRADETIKASLKEKEALLQEIHHRVKNNMQVISSLLNLQSQYIKNRESAELFKESQNRIKSMALIHEKLYLSEDMARIDFIAYIKNLADSLFAFYGANGRRIALHVSGGDAVFRIETAIPCGLIINELLSNSLKYAFPDNGEGKIIISIYPISENMFELTVSDNGIGIPEDIDVRNTKSLGLKLVEILTAQIHGEMELIRENGTTFRITFNKGKT
ncbi:MAG: sensor histidine kinase [Nitrospirae bacterium]|nr:sensor histidine kinase [Nitrospirota bacterium]